MVADGSGFSPPVPYFQGEDEPVAGFRQLLIDGDIYALIDEGMLKYFTGRALTWTLGDLPDEDDIRPGHDYRRLGATGGRGFGQLAIWDARHSRVVVFNKADGRYVAQWRGAAGGPAFSDVRGMFLVDRGEVEPPVLVWAGPRAVYRTVLNLEAAPQPSPGTTPAGSPAASPDPLASPTPLPEPTEPAGEPTERPRRTPRP
jgi:hypothetical protein